LIIFTRLFFNGS